MNIGTQVLHEGQEFEVIAINKDEVSLSTEDGVKIVKLNEVTEVESTDGNEAPVAEAVTEA